MKPKLNMKNIQEKYGRHKDFPALTPLIPVIGWSRTHKPIENMTPHYFPHHQLICILDGHVTFWSNGQIYSVSKGEVVLFKPYQVLGTLGNVMPASERCFIQFNIDNTALSSFQDRLKEIEILKTVDIAPLIKKIIIEHRDRDEFNVNLCESHLNEILVTLVRAKNKKDASDDGIKKSVDDFIEKNMSEKIDTSTLAEVVGYSSSYFREIMQDLVGMSPNKYILHRRYLKACDLLQNTDLNIFAIAMDTGFSSSQYFSTVFKDITSMSPNEFRAFYQGVMKTKSCSLENNKEVAERKSRFFVDGKWL